MQESVLLFVLRAEKQGKVERERERERERESQREEKQAVRMVKAPAVNLTCHCYIVNANIVIVIRNICKGLITLRGDSTGCHAAGWVWVDFYM